MTSPRILVVDDSPTALRLTSEALCDAGFDVVTAADGEQALEVASSANPDLVVLDIILPKLNGFQVCRKLKTDPATEDMRIVLLTSKSHEKDRFWGMKQGADGYITKPFDDEALIACIHKALEPAEAAEHTE